MYCKLCTHPGSPSAPTRVRFTPAPLHLHFDSRLYRGRAIRPYTVAVAQPSGSHAAAACGGSACAIAPSPTSPTAPTRRPHSIQRRASTCHGLSTQNSSRARGAVTSHAPPPCVNPPVHSHVHHARGCNLLPPHPLRTITLTVRSAMPIHDTITDDCTLVVHAQHARCSTPPPLLLYRIGRSYFIVAPSTPVAPTAEAPPQCRHPPHENAATRMLHRHRPPTRTPACSQVSRQRPSPTRVEGEGLVPLTRPSGSKRS